MNVKDRITADLKVAMRARDQVRLDTLRSVLSAFTYRRVEAGHDLSDGEQIAVVTKQVKQRNDSIGEYAKAGRDELVAKETHERDILAQYLPAQKTTEEIRAVVRQTIGELPADARNAGAVMKAVMPQLRGEADGNVVRTVVAQELATAPTAS